MTIQEWQIFARAIEIHSPRLRHLNIEILLITVHSLIKNNNNNNKKQNKTWGNVSIALAKVQSYFSGWL